MKKLIIILLSLTLFSCASRKVDIDIKKKDSTSIDVKKDIVVKTTDSAFSNIAVSKSETDEVIITPIDSTKEIIVNGKKYFNVVLKHKKSKNSTYTNNTGKVVKKENRVSNTTSKKRVATKDKEKNVDVNNNAIWLFILALIVIIVIVLNMTRKFAL